METLRVDLIEKSCSRTTNHDLCVASLRSDPQSSKVDIKGLARIMFRVTLVKARTILQQIHHLNDQTTDPILKTYFLNCIDQYESAVFTDIPGAFKSLDSNDYEQGSTYGVYVGSDTEECEDGFQGPPEPRKSPLTNENKALFKLSRVASELVYMLITKLVVYG
ncbi:unnamed protein product [Ilex paraguariensis]|uniref:Pectinesterase inhibitor domain-containing protein n=1 Tax=Ilex paraguariensis TaxID=185542 RepID=A0ABC8UGM8_9AQUA